MPTEQFYEGLPLAAQLEKFIDHHSDHRTRHISAYEAQMLDRVRSRLNRKPSEVKRDVAVEERDVYEELSQLYETVIYAESMVLSANSFPRWHLDVPERSLRESGLVQLAEDPSDVEVHAAVAALLGTHDGDLVDRFLDLRSSMRKLEGELDPESFALLNRILYLPTIVAENSWADVAPLLDHLRKARAANTPTFIFGGTLFATGHVAIALVAGGSVIVLRLLNDVAEGMSPGMRDLGRQFTRRWSQPPTPPVSEPDPNVVPMPTTKAPSKRRALPPGSSGAARKPARGSNGA